jgi:hypothetical protein
MKLFLAGVSSHKIYIEDIFLKLSKRSNFYILESFFTVKEWIFDYVDKENFLLDSGAFSMFSGQQKNLDIYVNEYVDFINKHNLKYFFELDIYSIIGLKETEDIRNYIEEKTGKKTIPVWHIALGVDYYKMLCKKYNYIAIGASGKHDSKWTRKTPEKLKALVDYANSKNVKVHGLGYTDNKIKNIPFYSVDSTTWLYGNRYGICYVFQNNKMNQTPRPKNKKINQANMAKYNFEQWVKFQNYIDTI